MQTVNQINCSWTAQDNDLLMGLDKDTWECGEQKSSDKKFVPDDPIAYDQLIDMLGHIPKENFKGDINFAA